MMAVWLIYPYSWYSLLWIWLRLSYWLAKTFTFLIMDTCSFLRLGSHSRTMKVLNILMPILSVSSITTWPLQCNTNTWTRPLYNCVLVRLQFHNKLLCFFDLYGPLFDKGRLKTKESLTTLCGILAVVLIVEKKTSVQIYLTWPGHNCSQTS